MLGSQLVGPGAPPQKRPLHTNLRSGLHDMRPEAGWLHRLLGQGVRQLHTQRRAAIHAGSCRRNRQGLRPVGRRLGCLSKRGVCVSDRPLHAGQRRQIHGLCRAHKRRTLLLGQRHRQPAQPRTDGQLLGSQERLQPHMRPARRWRNPLLGQMGQRIPCARRALWQYRRRDPIHVAFVRRLRHLGDRAERLEAGQRQLHQRRRPHARECGDKRRRSGRVYLREQGCRQHRHREALI